MITCKIYCLSNFEICNTIIINYSCHAVHYVKVTQSYLTLRNPMVRILQAQIVNG